jgi:predicted RNase H-like HicB family nuclease
MPNYSFNVFWSEPDRSYIAICPEFESLSAFGNTPDEALAEMRTVLEMAIETYQEKGWPLPEPKAHPEYSGQLRLRLPRTLHAKLALQAAAEGVSLNTLIVNYLAESIGSRQERIPSLSK